MSNASDTTAPGQVRLCDLWRENAPEKRKYPSSDPEKQRERNMKKKQNSTSRKCHVNYNCKTKEDEVAVQNKVDLVKKHLGRGNHNKSTNYEALCEVLDSYLATNLDAGLGAHQGPAGQEGTEGQRPVPQYQYVTNYQAKEEDSLYVGTVSSLKDLP